KPRHNGWGSVNHCLINPFGLHVVSAPIWNFPATLFYCCAITVFEWNCGHVIVLPPIPNLGSLIIHLLNFSKI
ncbi:MAG: hypothetical protein QNK19_02550, partial [Xanthomonadales bacterium]|nr:hypothetical protein [Xanthomonadales bacterium]